MAEVRKHPVVSSILAGLVVLGLAVSLLLTSAPVSPTFLGVSNYNNAGITLFRLFSPSQIDHFYTTSLAEKTSVLGTTPPNDYRDEGSPGQVYADNNAPPGTLPLFRLYSGAQRDHFYTTDSSETAAATAAGYRVEGTAGRCMGGESGPDAQLLTEFYRLYKGGSAGDHFYTTDGSEAIAAVTKAGYTFEGVACFILETLG